MDATQELDKGRSNKPRPTKAPDPVFEAVKAFWMPLATWAPWMVNPNATKPDELFPLLSPPWMGWWKKI